jgi:hypothetical protein
MTKFPSDFDGTCSWCGKVLPSERQVFCNDDCQGRYNRAADRYYEARHNPTEPADFHYTEYPDLADAPVGVRTNWFGLAADLARTGLGTAGLRRGVKS